jgi:hypothetical protein
MISPQAGGPPVAGCPRLLIHYIRSYPGGLLLHSQPEDEPCRGLEPLGRFSLNFILENFTENCEAISKFDFGGTHLTIPFHENLKFFLHISHKIVLGPKHVSTSCRNK